MSRWGVLLVNLGTPDAPRPPEVRRYLREFLSDPRVLDISPLGRWIILNVFILPFRPRRSAAAYAEIWTERGSPLLVHGRDLARKLQERLGPEVQVELAMRYGRPSVAGALEEFRQRGIDRIVVFSLFPHYSSSTWGSAVEKVFAEAGRLWNVPAIQVVPPYYDHPAFLDALAAVARPQLDALQPDRVLMSFHGLPERQVLKSDESGGGHCLRSDSCCEAIVAANRNCYRAQCFATARGVAKRLRLEPRGYAVSFQSRLGRDRWIGPYTQDVINRLAGAGVRKLAVLCPAFTADCLETLEEIGMRAREDFEARGGEELRLVPSLNSEDAWVEAIERILGQHSVLGAL
jgi:ferrochelatase